MANFKVEKAKRGGGYVHVYSDGRRVKVSTLKPGQTVSKTAVQKAQEAATRNRSFTDPVTQQQLTDELNAGVRLEYGGQQAALDKDIAGSGQRTLDIGSWYKNYTDRITAAQQAQQQLASSFAPTATPTPAPAPQGTPEAQQGEAVRTGLAGAFDGMLRSQAQGAANVYQGMGVNAGQGEVGWKLEEAKNLADLQQQNRNLQAEKGAFRTSYKGDLRDAERQYGLDLRSANAEEAAFGVEQAANQDQADQEFFQKYGISIEDFNDGLTAKERKTIRQTVNTLKGGSSSSGSKTGNGGNTYGYSDKQWKGMSYSKRLAAKKAWEKTGGSKSGSKNNTSKSKGERNARTDEAFGNAETINAIYDSRIGKEYDPDNDPDTDNSRPATHGDVLNSLRGDGQGKYSQDQLKIAMAVHRYNTGKVPFDKSALDAAKRLRIKVPSKYRPKSYPDVTNSDGRGPK